MAKVPRVSATHLSIHRGAAVHSTHCVHGLPPIAAAPAKQPHTHFTRRSLRRTHVPLEPVTRVGYLCVGHCGCVGGVSFVICEYVAEYVSHTSPLSSLSDSRTAVMFAVYIITSAAVIAYVFHNGFEATNNKEQVTVPSHHRLTSLAPPGVSGSCSSLNRHFSSR